MIRVMIAEDEALAVRHLERLIGERPELTLVGTAGDGARAIEMLRTLKPDVLFLDVQLPVHHGLQVLAALDYEPHVVFTTAYESHAVAAFQLGAVDYLLKPFSDERFHEAVARVLRVRAFDDADDVEHEPVGERIVDPQNGNGLISRLFVRDRQAVRVVPVAQIERAEADGNYTALIVGGKKLLAYLPLRELNARLDPAQFLRIHRGHLVNLDYVAGMQWYDGSRLQIEMRDGTKLLASRTRSRDLRRLMV